MYSSKRQPALAPVQLYPQDISSRSSRLELATARPGSVPNEWASDQQFYLQLLKELANRSPRQLDYPFRCWTVSWLNYHLRNECGIYLSDRQVSQMLGQLGISIQAASTSPQDWMPPSSRVTVGNLAAQTV